MASIFYPRDVDKYCSDILGVFQIVANVRLLPCVGLNNINNNNLYSYIALHHIVNALSALHVGIHLGFKASQSTQAQPMCHSHL
jgi:hypothetical protein